MTIYNVGREDVGGVWVWITKEVGKAHGREGVTVAERVFVKLHHNRGTVVLFLFVLIPSLPAGVLWRACPRPEGF